VYKTALFFAKTSLFIDINLLFNLKSLSLFMEKLKVLDDPWYQNGVSFKCTGCGGCCTGGPGYTFVSIEEMEEIANHLNLSLDAFTKKYVRKVLGDRFSLLENPKNYDCVFLKEKKCSIYPVRPTQCRTYPFWPGILASKESFEEASRVCEGINHKDAPIVPFETIEKELKSQEKFDKISSSQ
jgi:Fe-S-cluster containining protein